MTCNDTQSDLGNLIEKLDVGLEVSQSTKIFNPHHMLYKNKSNAADIERRRQIFLQNQRTKRRDSLMKIRRLTSISIDDGDEEEKFKDENMEIETSISQGSLDDDDKEEKFNRFKDQLMLSEWLTRRPFDLHENWFLVICPIGKRCLVVTSSGQTKAYSRTGHYIASFPSFLPGGNRRDNCAFRKSAILDCIYSETEKTYFILDVMLWNQSHFYDSETSFRFYWLDCKIREEYNNLSTIAPLNPYKFILLDHHEADDSSIIRAIQSYSYKAKIDGLLFFHKKAHYIPEVSPLVCWLKLNMLKDVLGIEIDAPMDTESKIED